MPCFYCGKRVSIVRQFTDPDFCSDDHRKRYHELTRVALNRLMEPQHAAPRVPDPVVPSLPPKPVPATPVQAPVLSAETPAPPARKPASSRARKQAPIPPPSRSYTLDALIPAPGTTGNAHQETSPAPPQAPNLPVEPVMWPVSLDGAVRENGTPHVSPQYPPGPGFAEPAVPVSLPLEPGLHMQPVEAVPRNHADFQAPEIVYPDRFEPFRIEGRFSNGRAAPAGTRAPARSISPARSFQPAGAEAIRLDPPLTAQHAEPCVVLFGELPPQVQFTATTAGPLLAHAGLADLAASLVPRPTDPETIPVPAPAVLAPAARQAIESSWSTPAPFPTAGLSACEPVIVSALAGVAEMAFPAAPSSGSLPDRNWRPTLMDGRSLPMAEMLEAEPAALLRVPQAEPVSIPAQPMPPVWSAAPQREWTPAAMRLVRDTALPESVPVEVRAADRSAHSVTLGAAAPEFEWHPLARVQSPEPVRLPSFELETAPPRPLAAELLLPRAEAKTIPEAFRTEMAVPVGAVPPVPAACVLKIDQPRTEVCPTPAGFALAQAAFPPRADSQVAWAAVPELVSPVLGAAGLAAGEPAPAKAAVGAWARAEFEAPARRFPASTWEACAGPLGQGEARRMEPVSRNAALPPASQPFVPAWAIWLPLRTLGTEVCWEPSEDCQTAAAEAQNRAARELAPGWSKNAEVPLLGLLGPQKYTLFKTQPTVLRFPSQRGALAPAPRLSRKARRSAGATSSAPCPMAEHLPVTEDGYLPPPEAEAQSLDWPAVPQCALAGAEIEPFRFVPPSRSHGLGPLGMALRWWHGAPGVIKASLFVIPLICGLFVQMHAGPELALRRAIQGRAVVQLRERFATGLTGWKGGQGWSHHNDGYMRIGRLALWEPSLKMTNYQMEFLADMRGRGFNWVFRAADSDNYYVNRLVVIKPGPPAELRLDRYPVVNGIEGRHVQIPVRQLLQPEMPFRVRMSVNGNGFTTFLADQMVDMWTDDRLSAGGIGFFAEKDDNSRVYWVNIWYQDDLVGKLCAYLAPNSRGPKE